MKVILVAAAALLISGSALAQQRDARGTVVQNEEPNVPAGVNQTSNIPPGATVQVVPNQAALFAPRPATATYPPCGPGETDRCTQTYERGTARPRR